MAWRHFDIDADQLLGRIEALGEVGRDDTGALFRGVYDQSWLAARDQLEQWMNELGLQTRIDAVGNLFGRVDGTDDGAPVILTGSHIDTVRNGGKYDGALGVHAAMSAVGAIAAAGAAPRRSIEVVALCEEEGSRFTSPLWGTQAMLGLIEPDVPASLVDVDGVSMTDAMRAVGLDPLRIPEARRADLGAFVELHIEQGGILEHEQVAAGVVTAITGQRHLVVTVLGKQNHAGSTPMDMRADALRGAAQMIVDIERIARERGRPAVATVGRLNLTPGSRNVIPGEVQFTVDIRFPDPDGLASLQREIESAARAAAADRGLDVKIDDVIQSAQTPVEMNSEIQELITAAAAELQVSSIPIVSGAGHDSQLFAQHVPTAMIFTPSRDGISHSPKEYTPIEQIVPPVRVLASVLWELATAESLPASPR